MKFRVCMRRNRCLLRTNWARWTNWSTSCDSSIFDVSESHCQRHKSLWQLEVTLLMSRSFIIVYARKVAVRGKTISFYFVMNNDVWSFRVSGGSTSTCPERHPSHRPGVRYVLSSKCKISSVRTLWFDQRIRRNRISHRSSKENYGCALTLIDPYSASMRSSLWLQCETSSILSPLQGACPFSFPLPK
jgi:hypothetical protein